jgi:hypothetical protein
MTIAAVNTKIMRFISATSFYLRGGARLPH